MQGRTQKEFARLFNFHMYLGEGMSSEYKDLLALAKKHGTERQLDIAGRLVAHGSTQLAAAVLGLSEHTIRAAMSKLRSRAKALKKVKPTDLAPGVDKLPGGPSAYGSMYAIAARKAHKRAGCPKHMVIPDTQNKPGTPINHIIAAGRYAAAKRPDVIVILGDWWDMTSLSSYDRGKRAMENRRYNADIQAGNQALEAFMRPINSAILANKWVPRLVFLMGNHEERIERFANDNPVLTGVVGYHHFNLAEQGFEVYNFLVPVVIDGVSYSHYHPKSSTGAVMNNKRGAPNAMSQLRGNMHSCTSGHKQGLETAEFPVGNRRVRSVIAGSFYQHDEAYMGPHGNDYWRGILVKHEVRDGDYDLMEVSLSYLLRKYGNT